MRQLTFIAAVVVLILECIVHVHAATTVLDTVQPDNDDTNIGSVEVNVSDSSRSSSTKGEARLAFLSGEGPGGQETTETLKVNTSSAMAMVLMSENKARATDQHVKHPSKWTVIIVVALFIFTIIVKTLPTYALYIIYGTAPKWDKKEGNALRNSTSEKFDSQVNGPEKEHKLQGTGAAIISVAEGQDQSQDHSIVIIIPLPIEESGKANDTTTTQSQLHNQRERSSNENDCSSNAFGGKNLRQPGNGYLPQFTVEVLEKSPEVNFDRKLKSEMNEFECITKL